MAESEELSKTQPDASQAETPRKPLEFETVEFTAGDGMKLNLLHVKQTKKATLGPVLLVHGAGVRANIFMAPVETNIVEYLTNNGYDVWLENWRASMEFEPNIWSLDKAALFDHPKAVEKVVELTGAKTIKAVIHCQGSTSFMMSAVAGLVPQVDTIISNAVSLHPVVRRFPQLKINLAPKLVGFLTDYLNPQWAKNPQTFIAKLIKFIVELTHHECDNSVCKHASFAYGSGHPTLWRHENLNDDTHQWLSDEFGFLPLNFYTQMGKSINKGHLLSVDNHPTLPNDFVETIPKTDARFAFFAGKKNDCFLPESQERTFAHFDKMRPNFHSLHLVEGYGHLCMFMGKNAVNDVFPLILEELNKKKTVPPLQVDQALNSTEPLTRPQPKTKEEMPMLFFESAKKRIKRLAGHHALVDGIPYVLPVNSTNSPAFMSLYSIDAEKAKKYMLGDEIHPLRLLNGRAVLVFTVIDYRETDIGKYIEYSIAIACTHGPKPAPRLLPAMLMKTFKTGQCVIDLPVSSEISVKGGRGIWGMPKHQQSLNFLIKKDTISAQYDLDGELAVKVTIPKPSKNWLPINIGAANYCAFRGMLMKSYVYFKTKLGFSLGSKNKKYAELIVGDHPRVQWLKDLDIADSPMITAYLPTFEGNLDDHFECWFLTSKDKITEIPEGLETTHPLGYGENWPLPIKLTEQEQAEVEQVEAADSNEARPAGITFSETMAGGFSLDDDDPAEGAKKGKAVGDVLAMHATIKIDDMEKFINDPEHRGSITGSIDFTPFGQNIKATSGVFNLFNPTDSPEMKYMVYEFGFTHAGQEYYLAGRKEVKQDKGFDLWSDTTTLYTRMYEGNNTEGKLIGAGILSLGVTDLLAMTRTFKAINSNSSADSIRVLSKFGRFFMGELWSSYGPDKASNKAKESVKEKTKDKADEEETTV